MLVLLTRKKNSVGENRREVNTRFVGLSSEMKDDVFHFPASIYSRQNATLRSFPADAEPVVRVELHHITQGSFFPEPSTCCCFC
jgi:hypothetical protein